MATFDFFDDAIKFGKDLAEDVVEFVQDISLEDVETATSIALGGVAIHSALQDTDPALDTSRNAAQSLKTGADISSTFAAGSDPDLGEIDEADQTNKRATRNRLRVQRTSSVGSATGLNPLSIQI